MAILKQTSEDSEDCFPIGMRVLAVDDNPPCLLLLATLLRRCKYRVTTTNQAILALRILRERKEDFDLVISDVDMPDMDGFKLLEHVGLEMDLPVIMLSSHSDPKLVMRGITHGACDYLVKPVRIEELQNIWQHVFRRKTDGKAGEKGYNDNEDGVCENRSKKRKEQKDDEEDGYDNDRCDNEDSNSQKKPRVVWSVELHGKFVAAVNQLGLDKAVPKKILDLMNVDKLTRENVASHLQKYRLYLKRIKSVANQQALVDPTYMHSSMNGFGSHFPIRALANRGMLRRLNSSPGFSLRDLPSVPQFNNLEAPEYNNYFQNNILQGMPVSDGGIHQMGGERREESTVFGSSSNYQGEKTVAIEGEALKHVYPMGDNWCGVARDDILSVNLGKDNIARPLQPIGGLVRNPINGDFPVQFDSGVPVIDGSNQLLVGGSSLCDGNYSILDGPVGPRDGYMVAQQCMHSSYASNCFGSLEDLVGSVVKQEQGWGI